MGLLHDLAALTRYHPLLFLAAAYLLGSIPTAIWVSKAFFGDDVRNHGSGNAGSTNVYRVYGFKAGFPVQMLDIGKAMAAVLLMQWALVPCPEAAVAHCETKQLLLLILAGVAAVLGHVYTLFAGFKGGKGVNCMLGMMLVLAPMGSVVGAVGFALLFFSTGMVSVGSMAGVLAFAGYQTYRYASAPEPANLVLLVVGWLLFGLVVYTHRSNLGRIARGEERKVRFRKG